MVPPIVASVYHGGFVDLNHDLYGVIDRIALDVTLEFRSFVVNDRLCAVTQYSNLIHAPWLVRHYNVIQDRILAFFDQHVKKQLSATNRTITVCRV